MGDFFRGVSLVKDKAVYLNVCSFARKSRKMLISLTKMTHASVMRRLKANGASLMSDFRRASPKLAWLRQCHITNESTETKNCY